MEMCPYCIEDSDGYVKPLEKNSHAFIRFGMGGWEIDISAKGWHGSAKIRYCPMCGRKLSKGDKMSNDLISRQAALDCFHDWLDRYGDVHTPEEMPEYRAIESLPSIEPEPVNNPPKADKDVDEWCRDCKEYDSERHCCPRFNRVIREAMKEGGDQSDTD